MNFLAWILSLSLMVLTLSQTVGLHRATVCRQRAWTSGVESITRSLLHQAKNRETFFIPHCRLTLFRQGQTVRWKAQQLSLELPGQL